MIELRQHREDMDFTPYDYVFEGVKKFENVLSFLLPKLDGEWHILLAEPKPSYIHTYLDTSVISSYIRLLITVEPNQLEQLYLERPNLVERERTNWGVYTDLIKEFPIPMDNKAIWELYYHAGPKEESLRAALNELMDYLIITMRETNKHFAPITHVYANQVVRTSLLGSYKRARAVLSMLERELGSTIAFYAMRKNIRRVFAEECKYLQNESIKDSIVEKVDGCTIILLYWLFETAVRPEQLYPILYMFERRQTPC